MSAKLVVNFSATADADPALIPPKRASAGAAGYDLRANLPTPILLQPGAIAVVPTGLQIALPEGFEAQIRPRSGLAIKHGVTVVNAPGTIDWDYRGEIKIGLVNLGHEYFEITHAMRVAQMIIAAVQLVDFVESALDETVRGAGGFGSTGAN